MINFKGLFKDEASAIGLASLGVKKKTRVVQQSEEKNLSTRLKESKTMYSATRNTQQQATQPTIRQLSKEQTELHPLTPLFSAEKVLNFNNNTLLG